MTAVSVSDEHILKMLDDGELRDYKWLNEHKAELGNDGTEYEARPGDLKWVYPIKWAGRTYREATPADATDIRETMRKASDAMNDRVNDAWTGDAMVFRFKSSFSFRVIA